MTNGNENNTTNQGRNEVWFSCIIENLKSVTDVLDCLTLYATAKDCDCCVEATPSELVLVVTGKAKNTQARYILLPSLTNFLNSVNILLAL